MSLAPSAASLQGEIEGGSSSCTEMQGLGTEDKQRPMPEAEVNYHDISGHRAVPTWIFNQTLSIPTLRQPQLINTVDGEWDKNL